MVHRSHNQFPSKQASTANGTRWSSFFQQIRMQDFVNPFCKLTLHGPNDGLRSRRAASPGPSRPMPHQFGKKCNKGLGCTKKQLGRTQSCSKILQIARFKAYRDIYNCMCAVKVSQMPPLCTARAGHQEKQEAPSRHKQKNRALKKSHGQSWSVLHINSSCLKPFMRQFCPRQQDHALQMLHNQLSKRHPNRSPERAAILPALGNKSMKKVAMIWEGERAGRGSRPQQAIPAC